MATQNERKAAQNKWKQDERDRNRALGLKLVTVWAYPEDSTKVKDFANYLLNNHKPLNSE